MFPLSLTVYEMLGLSGEADTIVGLFIPKIEITVSLVLTVAVAVSAIM